MTTDQGLLVSILALGLVYRKALVYIGCSLSMETKALVLILDQKANYNEHSLSI